MREPYICPDCDQRSTRWWNLKVHMKRKHGGFLLGKSSDGYMANNPPLLQLLDCGTVQKVYAIHLQFRRVDIRRRSEHVLRRTGYALTVIPD
jgi:hypothetical protein